jgi:nicotinamidase-related amidase
MRSRAETTLLAVIDVQERLAAVIDGAERIVQRSIRLARAAELLGVRRVVTEQYPRGLGRTVPALAACLPPPEEKLTFSAAACGCLAGELDAGIETVVLVGFETHVCILQTALDLLGRGFTVMVAVDVVGSRYAIDHETALRRLELSGCLSVTSESVMFEWCGSAEHPRFREMQRLVKEG